MNPATILAAINAMHGRRVKIRVKAVADYREADQ
jgi:hypothetical protein